eukprot:comp22489_c0_seq1/m.55874 comp22489_c0_seq1/g.55874  ORF comp22489_c0_seq1/g.55874 comp22489_c0_seq1/m.55874 type:complete len:436 (+) comp22489_c0_seq1:3712-5019(+)
MSGRHIQPGLWLPADRQLQTMHGRLCLPGPGHDHGLRVPGRALRLWPLLPQRNHPLQPVPVPARHIHRRQQPDQRRRMHSLSGKVLLPMGHRWARQHPNRLPRGLLLPARHFLWHPVPVPGRLVLQRNQPPGLLRVHNLPGRLLVRRHRRNRPQRRMRGRLLLPGRHQACDPVPLRRRHMDQPQRSRPPEPLLPVPARLLLSRGLHRPDPVLGRILHLAELHHHRLGSQLGFHIPNLHPLPGRLILPARLPGPAPVRHWRNVRQRRNHLLRLPSWILLQHHHHRALVHARFALVRGWHILPRKHDPSAGFPLQPVPRRPVLRPGNPAPGRLPRRHIQPVHGPQERRRVSPLPGRLLLPQGLRQHHGTLCPGIVLPAGLLRPAAGALPCPLLPRAPGRPLSRRLRAVPIRPLLPAGLCHRNRLPARLLLHHRRGPA